MAFMMIVTYRQLGTRWEQTGFVGRSSGALVANVERCLVHDGGFGGGEVVMGRAEEALLPPFSLPLQILSTGVTEGKWERRMKIFFL